MMLFTCRYCRNTLHFENTVCLSCGHKVGFDPASMSMITLIDLSNNLLASTSNKRKKYSFCINATYRACNWLLEEKQGFGLCRSCLLNRIVPFLGTHRNMERWKTLEKAKHRLVYALLRLHLPVTGKAGNHGNGLAFDFLEDTPNARVMTGHLNGVITINIEEADEVQRTRNKAWLGESYRTLLGHFRHESGHYYWDILVKNHRSAAAKFRKLFGDERQDYAAAVAFYYANGPKKNWEENYISAYATMHPWEDWAETWAHYMHMMDTLETAHVFGIRTRRPDGKIFRAVDPFTIGDFEQVVASFVSVVLAANSLNTAMGHGEFYPFHLSTSVIGKLTLIHNLVTGYELLALAASRPKFPLINN